MPEVLENRSKFRRVADSFVIRICRGELVPGAKFFSRQELCAQFDISPMTAHRVQSELKRLGLIAAAPGAGFVVQATGRTREADHAIPLRKVLSIGGRNAIGPGTRTGERVMRGISEACTQYGLRHEIEFVDVLEHLPGYLNTARKLAPDEGLVLFLVDSLLPEVAPLLIGRGVRAVTINESFPGRAAVLKDFRWNLKLVLDEFARAGRTRLVIAGGFNLFAPNFNESSQLAAFEDLAEERNLVHDTDFSGNFRQIAERCRALRADGLLFIDAAIACHFMRSRALEPAAPVLIAGIEGWGEGPEAEQIILGDPDWVEMGRSAVRLLRQIHTPPAPIRHLRVRGTVRPPQINNL